ncbi:hypothetical protein B7494_g4164 [Chlorociboria aeruginascens]|nr:hypothetical protein B7494_g4164 [Chlorociboria aeruginascens]
MPKRKRGASDDYDRHGRINSMRAQDITAKLLESKKTLHRALKTAKGFERQKLGKRLKSATTNGDAVDIARINKEIEVLKKMEMGKMVESYLYKNLLKTKSVVDSGSLPEEVRDWKDNEGLGDEEEIKALRNVCSGMFNMKGFKDAFGGVMNGLFLAMEVPIPVKDRKKGKEKGARKRVASSTLQEESGVSAVEEADERRDESWEELNSEDQEKNEHQHDDDLDEETLSRSDDGSLDPEGYETKPPCRSINQPSISFSPSPSLSATLEPSPPTQSAPKRQNAPRAPAPNPSGSTFLPTLMGGYWSGSESSASDLEDSPAAPLPMKKNNKGQRERRLIWEKKYGVKANHIKQGKGSVLDANGKAKGKERDDDGWDAKRGAREGGDRRGWKGRGGSGFNGAKGAHLRATGENATPVKGERRKRGMGRKDDEGIVHPSWAAAKAAKEMKQNATFAGKKMVFD